MMPAFRDPPLDDDTGHSPIVARKRWSARKIVVATLGAYIALVLVSHALERSRPVARSGGESSENAEPPLLPQRVVTLEDALSDYQKANAACESATTAMERRTGTIQGAINACGDSLQAVSDLPTLYGAQASALQSCIDMEGERFGGLSMLSALHEHRGQPGEVLSAEQNYRTRFHWASLRCKSDLLATKRSLGVAPIGHSSRK